MERQNAPPMFAVAASLDGAAGALPPEPVIETVRTFFPETWIWQLVEVGYVYSLLSIHCF